MYDTLLTLRGRTDTLYRVNQKRPFPDDLGLPWLPSNGFLLVQGVSLNGQTVIPVLDTLCHGRSRPSAGRNRDSDDSTSSAP